MVWSPHYQVVDYSQVADNLLTYIDANQTEALNWANGGSGLADFAKFYTNAVGRLQTTFPSLMVLAYRAETNLEGDLLESGMQITMEGTVSGNDTDQLVQDAKRYAKAVESMVANIPSAALTANSDPAMTARLFEVESVFDILRPWTSGYLQIFQTRCIYVLSTGVF